MTNKLDSKKIKTSITGGNKTQLTKLILILVISCFSFNLSAQSGTSSKPTTILKTGTISGKVMDQNLNETVAYATIVLKSKAENNIVTGGISNENGNFKIKNIPEGEFLLEVQFIGYKTYKREITISIKDSNMNLGTIFIEEAAQALEGVEVIAERSTIEQKIDRKVINVGRDLATAGATASDIMINIPSVDTDQDGNISLRGNTNVRILIDGKPTNMNSSQLLQQIPSSSIKKIELITNPSAKYNPEGMSGIINIVLHKSAKIGFNGSTNVGLRVGKKTRFNSALDLNYRTGKFNIYGNYGNTVSKSPLNGRVNREADNSNEIWESFNNIKTNLFKIGVDYYLNDRNTISIYTNQNIFDHKVWGITDISFNGGSPTLGQRYDSKRENLTSTYNFDYKHTFKKEGHSIEIEADYNAFSGDEITDFNLYNENLINISVDDIINDRTNTTLNLDYINPLSETTKIELGAEARLQHIDNEYGTTNANLNSSHYEYDRDIYSAYGTFGQNLNKWSYQIGARLENYEVTGNFDQEGSSVAIFKDEIFSVYPSAFLSYIPDEENKKNTYQISYSRRVDRPGLEQINPIRVWSSARVTNVGNPNLIPQFTNSLEFNYTRRLDKGSLTTAIFYRQIKDEITRFAFTDPNDPTRIFFSYGNNADNSAYGFEISGNYKPLNWWSFTTSFDLYAQTKKGVAEDEAVEVDNVLYNFRMNNSFKASKNLTFQIIGLYRGPNETLQYTTDPYYFVNAGARYSFAQGKGTLSLNFNDIFKTRVFAFDATRPIVQKGRFQGDVRTVFVGLGYRFGSGKNKNLKRKKRDKNEKRADGF